MLGSLSGVPFLDLYAGSGAVGLEAASRGAAPVHLVERDPVVVRTLRANVRSLDLPGVVARVGAVERLLADGPAADDPRFRVVFVDPPYASSVDEVLGLLVSRGWLADAAVVVVERDARNDEIAWPEGLQPERSRRYGDSVLWYGRRP
jgi:16S rRNA (guanine966-N2)-methyltransferase